MNAVLVIGAGLAGLSAACYLTGRGYAVTVVEREEVPGGRAGLLVKDGFTFDTGPTVLTMPDLIADALRAVDADLDHAADAPARPGLPGLLRRRQHDPGPAPVARRCGRRSTGPAAAWTPPRSTTSSTGCSGCTQVEMPHFIDAQLRLPARAVSAPRARSPSCSG